MRIKVGEDIPEGWVRGRKPSVSKTFKGKFYITNGVDEILIETSEIIPKGWKKGRKELFLINNKKGKQKVKKA